METIYIDYKNTGIKTLRGIAWFILIAGLIATLIVFISSVSLGRYGGIFLWSTLSSMLLMLAATLFGFGVCFALAYLSESAFVARKQREALLTEKGIELKLIDSDGRRL
jgi:energy-coupling factor transporter transmembrane protein EcfT